MIGDRGVDMRAARHHGVAAVGALWGFGTREELDMHGAQHVCASPRELPVILSRIVAPSSG
jgi:phosphoglycolate phosphatase